MKTRLLLVTVLWFGCGSAPQATPFKPVADVKQLMEGVVDPAADVVWDAAGTIITAEKVEEIAPKSDEEWAAVRNGAMVLAESGNLLMMSPRAKDSGRWMKLAQALVDAGAAALSAAKAKDVARVFTAGGDIYDACSNCHQRYVDAIAHASSD